MIDAGSRFSEPCLAAIELADQVIVVTTPEPTPLFATRRSRCGCCATCWRYPQRACASCRISRPRTAAWPATSLAEDARHRSASSTIPFGGEEVSQAGLDGFPLVMSHPGNPASQAILALARELERSAQEKPRRASTPAPALRSPRPRPLPELAGAERGIFHKAQLATFAAARTPAAGTSE